jgi:hypothetical protein
MKSGEGERDFRKKTFVRQANDDERRTCFGRWERDLDGRVRRGDSDAIEDARNVMRLESSKKRVNKD